MNSAAARHRHWLPFALGALAPPVYLAWRYWVLTAQRYNLDEFVHAHKAWEYAHGWRFLIEDCDLAHSPLLHHLLMPLFGLLGESGLLPYRLVLAALSLASLGAFAAFLRNLGAGRVGVLCGTTAAAVSAPFILMSHQIRHEPLMLVLAMVGLWLLTVAARSTWRWWLTASAGLCFGLATALKILIAPFALTVVLLFWWLSRDYPPPSRRRLIGAGLGLGAGALAPLLWLAWLYRPLLRALLAASSRALATSFQLFASFTHGPSSVDLLRHIVTEPLFWVAGVAAFAVIHQTKDRRTTFDKTALAMLLGAVGYLVFVPLAKGQFHPQDLVFPAFALSVALARAAEILLRTRHKWIPAVVIAAIVAESLLVSGIMLRRPDQYLDEIDRHLAEFNTALTSGEVGRSPRQSFTALYKLYDPFYAADRLTRREQDAVIGYFNRHVSPDALAMSSNAGNVFRHGPKSWAQGLGLAADQGLDFLFETNQTMPPAVYTIFQCLDCVGLFDVRARDMGENLVRDLDANQPHVVLIDRFFLDLWFEHPGYLEAFDRNYDLRYDPASRRFFAHRKGAPWVASGLPPREPFDCPTR